MFLGDLAKKYLDGEIEKKELEDGIAARLLDSQLVIRDRENVAEKTAKEVVGMLDSGELQRRIERMDSFSGWFERACLLMFVGREPMNDDEYSLEICDGDKVLIDVFFEEYTKGLSYYLKSLCDDDSPRSKDFATEVAVDLVADCLTGELQKYHAKGSLEGWLRTCARNRLKRIWKKDGRVSFFDEFDGHYDESMADGGLPEIFDGEEQIWIEATRAGFHTLTTVFPRWIVIDKLAYVFKVPQVTIAKMYGMDPSEISKMKSSGVAFLRSEINSYIRTRYPKYELDDDQLMALIHRFMRLARDEDTDFGAAEEEGPEVGESD